MDPAEYSNLANIEREHWYYRGKREVVRHWLMASSRFRPEQILLDCGAGTGLFAEEMSAHCRVKVVDDHEESLRMLRTRFRTEQIVQLEAGRIPLADASVDYVTALDVLEHVQDDAAVISDIYRMLQVGGLAAVTVPASMALWGDWDVGLHHYRRYSRREVKALFPEGQWELIYVNYTNVAVYPIVWAVRKTRKWFPSRQAKVRFEDRLPKPWINSILRWLFVRPALWRVSFPFGVSLILVARKRISL